MHWDSCGLPKVQNCSPKPPLLLCTPIHTAIVSLQPECKELAKQVNAATGTADGSGLQCVHPLGGNIIAPYARSQVRRLLFRAPAPGSPESDVNTLLLPC